MPDLSRPQTSRRHPQLQPRSTAAGACCLPCPWAGQGWPLVLLLQQHHMAACRMQSSPQVPCQAKPQLLSRMNAARAVLQQGLVSCQAAWVQPSSRSKYRLLIRLLLSMQLKFMRMTGLQDCCCTMLSLSHPSQCSRWRLISTTRSPATSC